jgi:hypothetical protein
MAGGWSMGFSFSESNIFGLTVAACWAYLKLLLAICTRGLSNGLLTSILLWLVIEMMLFDRLGISGAITVACELIDIVSDISFAVLCECTCGIWTGAKTVNSWRDDDTLDGGGDCSPSLVFWCEDFPLNGRVPPPRVRVPELLVLWRFGFIPGDFKVNSGHFRGYNLNYRILGKSIWLKNRNSQISLGLSCDVVLSSNSHCTNNFVSESPTFH